MIIYTVSCDAFAKENHYKVGQSEDKKTLNGRYKAYKTSWVSKVNEYFREEHSLLTDKQVHAALVEAGHERVSRDGGTEWFKLANPALALKIAVENVLKINASDYLKFDNFWDLYEGAEPSPEIVFKRIAYQRLERFRDAQNADTPKRLIMDYIINKAVAHVDSDKRFLVWFNLEIVYCLVKFKLVPKKNIWLYTECNEKARVAKKYEINVIRNLDEIGKQEKL